MTPVRDVLLMDDEVGQRYAVEQHFFNGGVEVSAPTGFYGEIFPSRLMEDDAREEGGREHIFVTAHNEGIKAHGAESEPGTHGAVVFIHLGHITVRAVTKCAANVGSGEFGIPAIF